MKYDREFFLSLDYSDNSIILSQKSSVMEPEKISTIKYNNTCNDNFKRFPKETEATEK